MAKKKGKAQDSGSGPYTWGNGPKPKKGIINRILDWAAQQGGDRK